MKKKALRKDFYLEIVKTRGRFLSILFIVALGVAFFSGIRASEPDMRYSADAYFDEHKLYDGKIVSTLGLTEADVEAIGKVEHVETVEGAYSLDALCDVQESQKVLHIMSLTEELNQLTVDEGRLPKKNDECFIDATFLANTPYKLGDYITFQGVANGEIEDTLVTSKYQIVGVGSSPSYISFGRGSSLIGTGEVSGFVYLPEKSFKQEFYTEAYVSIIGAKDKVAFTDDYDNLVNATLDKIEEITEYRGIVRRDQLVQEANEELNHAKEELEEAKETAQKQLDESALELENAKKRLQDGYIQLENGKQSIQDAKQTLQSKQVEIDNAFVQYQSGLERLSEGKSTLDEQIEDYHTNLPSIQAQIAQGEAAIVQGREQLAVKWDEYYQLLEVAPPESLLEMKLQLDEAEAALVEQSKVMAQTKLQVEQGAAALENAKEEIAQREMQLTSVQQQISFGQEQINNGWKELNAQEQRILVAEQELEDGQKQYDDGKVKYDEAEKEAHTKLTEGEQDIVEAQQKINDIKLPTWYIDSRNGSADYVGYGDNADRMRAIGRVFPILFFLVAALISLTTMTRMVEEQRIQIGTLKALGYNKISIVSKYLNYALIATFVGSVIGVLIGEKIFPFIIVYAYKIMYKSIPDIVIPYNWEYAIMATGTALLCTSIATIFSCYKELAADPAVLMRPPSPKSGKRILLERIPFLWKRLSFTWKSTMRNLIRYKKRFFMTVFGIGGCMALMLVGFGLKDSIFEIGTIQYEEVQLYDATVYLKDGISQEDKKELYRYIDQEEKIIDSTSIYMKNITISNDKVKKERDVYLCVPENTVDIEKFIAFRNRIDKKSYHLSDKGVILTEKAAKLLEVKKGDTLQITLDKNVTKKIKITDICENYMGHYMYMTPELYRTLQSDNPSYNGILLETGERSEQGVLKIGEKLLSKEGTLNVSYTHGVREQLDDMLGSLNIVIIVLIISAGMLAFVVLYNLNNININERKRELATIKVLGFYDKEVAAYVYRENILLTFIGALAGAWLGKILHRFVIVTVEIDNAMFGRNIDWSSYLISILFTIGFSLVVNWVMYYKLKKIDMIESLKSVE